MTRALRQRRKAPEGIEPEIAAIIEALARKMAREDHARSLQPIEASDARSNLRPVLKRPAD